MISKFGLIQNVIDIYCTLSYNVGLNREKKCIYEILKKIEC